MGAVPTVTITFSALILIEYVMLQLARLADPESVSYDYRRSRGRFRFSFVNDLVGLMWCRVQHAGALVCHGRGQTTDFEYDGRRPHRRGRLKDTSVGLIIGDYVGFISVLVTVHPVQRGTSMHVRRW